MVYDIVFALLLFALGMFCFALYERIGRTEDELEDMAEKVAELDRWCVKPSDTEEADPDKSRLMDEGFENIMRYSLNVAKGKKDGDE